MVTYAGCFCFYLRISRSIHIETELRASNMTNVRRKAYNVAHL